MSYCRKEGKDKIIFVTESDHAQPSKVPLPDFEDEAEYEGLIKANGEINWECPCLGGMATGVCGDQFKSAFSCFHVSQSEPKGSECIDQFRTMQECFNKYPDVYGEFESVDEDEKHDKELFNGEDDEEMNRETEQRRNDEIELSSQDQQVQLSSQDQNEVQLSSQDQQQVQLSSQDQQQVQLSSQDQNEVQLSSQDGKVVQESKKKTVGAL